jgi:superfamily II helicase
MTVIPKRCDHCRGILTSGPYRVISREKGVTMLDMIVCRACYVEARKLGLKTEKLASTDRYFSQPS